MKKGNIIIAGIIGTMMLAGCGMGNPSDNGISIVTEESSVEAQENTTVGAESSDVVSEDSTDSSSEDTAKTSAVDMKDYSEELTEEYGGKLEQELADALGTSVVIMDDDAGTLRTLCDGAIEIMGATNGSGFFVTQMQKVDNFSVFGVSVGMSADEASKTLEDQGFKASTETPTYYSVENSDYLIYLTDDGSNITEIKFVKTFTMEE